MSKKIDYRPFTVGDKVSRRKVREEQIGEVVEVCHETRRCRVQWRKAPGSQVRGRANRTWVKFDYLDKVATPAADGGDRALNLTPLPEVTA